MKKEKLTAKYFAPWGGHFEQGKEETVTETQAAIWDLEAEVAHRNTLCSECLGQIRIGHNFITQSTEPLVVAHASCVKKPKEETMKKDLTQKELDEISSANKKMISDKKKQGKLVAKETPKDEKPSEKQPEAKGYEQLTMKELVDLFNKRTGKKIYKFTDRETGISRLKTLDAEVPKPSEMIHCPGSNQRIPFGGCEKRQVKPKNKCVVDCAYFKGDKTKVRGKSGKVRGFKLNPNSKMGKIRSAFIEKKAWSLKDLMKRSNFDKANLMCAMSIFKNPKRTKELLVTDYDKKTETYTLTK